MTDLSDQSDAELVGLARQGDRNAYQALIARYQGHVYGMAYSIVGSWHEAQDIAQETFVRVYLNLDQLQSAERFASWLRRVAFSVTMNWLRAYRPQLAARLVDVDLDTLELPDFTPDPGEQVERRELGRAVMQAVAALPPKYRIPLTMFHLDGLSFQKVADFLDIPLGTAKSLISRARAKLRPALGAYLGTELEPLVQEVFDEHRLPADFARKAIAGLERARWGAGVRENSVFGALSHALQALGEPIGYEELMGLSGAAFRLQMLAEPLWCPSAPHACCGFSCLDAALSALGYRIERIPLSRDDPKQVERAFELVVGSIDRGRPLLYSSLEESLIVGYERAGRRLLLRPYGARQDGYVAWSLDREGDESTTADDAGTDGFVRDWTYLGLQTFEPTGVRAEPRARLLRSLALAVELARSERFDRYFSGFAAYRYWIDGLRDDARFEPKEAARFAMQANAHCYGSLCDARGAAVSYLRAHADMLADGARARMVQAAELYAELVERVLLARPAAEVAPFMLGPGEAWSAAQRHAQAALLERALELETRAVETIDDVLRLAS